MRAKIIFETARMADAAAIARIWNPVIRDTLITFNSQEKTDQEVADYIRTRQENGYGVFVAKTDGDCVGFASYGQFRGGIGYAKTMEHTIILAPGFRGQGVGRALLARVEDHARGAGVHSIFAGVSAANPEGIAFHEKLGYQRICDLPQVGYKFGRYIDLVLLQKFFTPDADKP